MGKYSELLNNVFSIFGTPTWTAEKIKTVPENFIAVNTKEEFVRVSVIPSSLGYNLNSVSGILIIDIFTQAGNGPKRSFAIADKLDSYLSGKSITVTSGKVVQLNSSAFKTLGKDIDNPTLFRSTYTIPFHYSEVL